MTDQLQVHKAGRGWEVHPVATIWSLCVSLVLLLEGRDNKGQWMPVVIRELLV